MNNNQKYTINKGRFDNISKQYSNISDLDFYTLQLKIGVREYVKCLNLHNVDAIRKDGESFAKKINGFWQPNNSLVLKCLERAKNNKEYRQTDFFKSNIVLDEMELKLKNL
jgi:hypothetical protein